MRPQSFFPPVVAAFTTDLGGLGGLTVEDGTARLGVTAHLDTDLLPQRGVHPRKRAIGRPFVEVVPDRGPGTVFLWEHPPLATGAVQVEQAVHDAAQVDPTSASAPSLRRNQPLQEFPLGIGQVGRVHGLPLMRHLFSRNQYTHPFLFFRTCSEVWAL